MFSKLKSSMAPNVGVQNKIVIYFLTSLLAGIASAVLFFCLFSAVVVMFDLPLYTVIPLSTLAVCIGTAMAGYVFALQHKKNGVIYGLCIGVATFVVIVVAAFFAGSNIFTQLAIIKLIAVAAAGAIGGYFGIEKADKTVIKY